MQNQTEVLDNLEDIKNLIDEIMETNKCHDDVYPQLEEIRNKAVLSISLIYELKKV